MKLDAKTFGLWPCIGVGSQHFKKGTHGVALHQPVVRRADINCTIGLGLRQLLCALVDTESCQPRTLIDWSSDSQPDSFGLSREFREINVHG